MKIPTLAKSQLIVYGVGAVVAAALAYAVYRMLKSPFDTEGTDYEDVGKMGGIPGAVGGLAAATDRLSGGLLSTAGHALGGRLYDFLNPPGNTETLLFTFSDTGKAGSVNSGDVDSAGRFNYFRTGVRYQLKKDETGHNYAVRI